RSDRGEPIGGVTISLGVAAHDANEDLDAWIGRADEALYRSKRLGRNRVSVATTAKPESLVAFCCQTLVTSSVISANALACLHLQRQVLRPRDRIEDVSLDRREAERPIQRLRRRHRRQRVEADARVTGAARLGADPLGEAPPELHAARRRT